MIIQHKLFVCFTVSGVESSPSPSWLAYWHLGVGWTRGGLFSYHKTFPLHGDSKLQPCGTTSHQLHVGCSVSNHTLSACQKWTLLHLVATPSHDVTGLHDTSISLQQDEKLNPQWSAKARFSGGVIVWKTGSINIIKIAMLDQLFYWVDSCFEVFKQVACVCGLCYPLYREWSISSQCLQQKNTRPSGPTVKKLQCSLERI